MLGHYQPSTTMACLTGFYRGATRGLDRHYCVEDLDLSTVERGWWDAWWTGGEYASESDVMQLFSEHADRMIG